MCKQNEVLNIFPWRKILTVTPLNRIPRPAPKQLPDFKVFQFLCIQLGCEEVWKFTTQLMEAIQETLNITELQLGLFTTSIFPILRFLWRKWHILLMNRKEKQIYEAHIMRNWRLHFCWQCKKNFPSSHYCVELLHKSWFMQLAYTHVHWHLWVIGDTVVALLLQKAITNCINVSEILQNLFNTSSADIAFNEIQHESLIAMLFFFPPFPASVLD